MKRRVIAFVDHEIGYRLLRKLISSRTKDLGLVAVVTTQENGQSWWPGVDGLCEKNGIPLHRYSEPFEAASGYHDVDWYFLLSWKHIIPSSLIHSPKCGVINLHYSLLPEYRGVYPVNWAITEGRSITGVTYHLVNEGIDAGEIICQKAEAVRLSDTARTLQLRLDDLAYDLFDEVLCWIVSESPGRPAFVSRERAEGSYRSRADFRESNEIDLNREYRAIDFLNLLRGRTFLPGSRNLFVIDPATGRRIYVSIHLDIGD